MGRFEQAVTWVDRKGLVRTPRPNLYLYWQEGGRTHRAVIINLLLGPKPRMPQPFMDHSLFLGRSQ